MIRSRWTRIPAGLVLAMAAAALSVPAAAAACAPARGAQLQDHQAQLELLSLESSCLGRAGDDPAPVTAAVHEAITGPTGFGQSGALVRALDALLAEAEAAVQDSAQAPLWLAMRRELQAARETALALEGVLSPADWTRTANRAFAPKWAAALREQPLLLDGARFELLRGMACDQGRPCAEFDSRVRALRIAVLMKTLAQNAQRPELARLLRESTLALERWRAYREKAHPQYVWELAINSARMGRDLCPRDSEGLRQGFCSTPSSQLIVLHPGAALRLSRSATKSSELRPAALVQIIGWYGWSWATVDGRETAVMNRPWGASLAATYTRSTNEDRWAFGPMFHYGRASLALTKAGGGGRWSLVLNVPLADRYFSTRDRAAAELARLDKRSAWGLIFD